MGPEKHDTCPEFALSYKKNGNTKCNGSMTLLVLGLVVSRPEIL